MAAMQEGVYNSRCIIAIVTGPAGDDTAYFRRPFCLSELRWATHAGIPIVPVVAAEDKGSITEFLSDIPPDLKLLKSTNWEHIDRTDKDYFSLGVSKILVAARLELAVENYSAPAAPNYTALTLQPMPPSGQDMPGRTSSALSHTSSTLSQTSSTLGETRAV